MSRSTAIYESLPIPAQHLACSYYGYKERRLRYGGDFLRTLNGLLETQWYDSETIRNMQETRLRRMMAHAYEHSPFYRRRLESLALRPSDILTREDLSKLPVLTKDAVRNSFDTIRAPGLGSPSLITRYTSGTTGSSLRFQSTASSIRFQWAVWWRHRSRFGIHFPSRHANFTGKVVVPPMQTAPPYWRWNLPLRQAVIPMQQITPEKAPDIVRFLATNSFEFYSGYPSVIGSLAAFALQADLRLREPPTAVITGAENILGYQRRDIAAFTGSVVTDQYGISEGCANASSCWAGNYHEDSEFCILECVDPDVMDDGRIRGRLVATGLACPQFPFIRYDVGDVAIWKPQGYECPCGLQSPVLDSIEGRTDDYVVTPEGHKVMRFDYIFKAAVGVQEAQVIQSAPDSITLLLATNELFDKSAAEEHLRSEVLRWVSPSLEVLFEYTDQIPRSPSGKFKAVHSTLKGPSNH